MHSFRDAAGRSWEIVGNFANFARVKDRTGVDLFNLATPGQQCLDQIADLYTLGNVLWAFCERQAHAAGVTEEQFGESLCGPELDAAQAALVEEAIFFSRHDRREILELAMSKVRAREPDMAVIRQKAMAEASAAMDAALDQLIRSSSGTSSPASSESTPPTGRSASSGGRRAASSATSGTTRAR